MRVTRNTGNSNIILAMRMVRLTWKSKSKKMIISSTHAILGLWVESSCANGMRKERAEIFLKEP